MFALYEYNISILCGLIGTLSCLNNDKLFKYLGSKFDLLF